MADLALKAALLEACRAHVSRQLANARQAMDHAQQAANEEGKSSAGDKYETGRAMMQIERDQAAAQAEEALKLQRVLDQLPVEPAATVALGSLVVTDQENFFVAIGLGKIAVNDAVCIVVGPASPLGRTVIGLKVGDTFSFNKRQLVIRAIV